MLFHARALDKEENRSSMPRKKVTKRQPPERQKTVAEALAQPAPVRLPQFGDGTVTAIAGPRLSIVFDKRGEKQILDGYVKRLKK